jgi:uncharacterized membrane protein YGL010W
VHYPIFIIIACPPFDVTYKATNYLLTSPDRAVNIVDVEKGLSPTVKSTRRYRRHVRNKRKHYLGIAALCFITAIICVVLEAFALFNIEYCDGEDLMQLYWGFWSILQVGSLIAIGGVMVQFWIVMGAVETPSWAVALGTPVLVFAALGWVFRFIGKRAWARATGKEVEDTESEGSDQEDEEKNGSDHWVSRAQVFLHIKRPASADW